MTMQQTFLQEFPMWRRKEIVLVEPDDAFAEFFTEVVRQEPLYALLRVATGERALQVVPQLKPDLLIMDFCLPDMTGIEVFEHLHAVDKLTSLPVMLINTDPSSKQELSCHAFPIATVFDIDSLLQRIEDVLSS
ncbi:hypothetical protein KSF_005880 [Reticulibacter mediterranei]|uniref:Response regulatory domain-containing protein n=1 Tax=Reticulibacter mediterranei TaxID=2778369 RepID=A0A8J3IGW4_9CHLR|nr:response regulator [Reticulibacter mediterranei]GHO90540.1 hypothetical protein KSF_005880 [Reticulibacter mediterranei]